MTDEDKLESKIVLVGESGVGKLPFLHSFNLEHLI